MSPPLWAGPAPTRCDGTRRNGQPCTQFAVEGLNYCVCHVPPEYLEEAETITGLRRCTGTSRFYGDACQKIAVAFTVPPRCTSHGANRGSVLWKQAQRRKAETARAVQLIKAMQRAHAAGQLLPREQELERQYAQIMRAAGRL